MQGDITPLKYRIFRKSAQFAAATMPDEGMHNQTVCEPYIDPLNFALYRTWQHLEKPKRICSWCDATLTEGSLPATHTICELCRKEKF